MPQVNHIVRICQTPDMFAKDFWKGQGMTYDQFDREGFGALVRSRRKRLRFPQTGVPGGPSSTYLSAIERGDPEFEFTDDVVDKLAFGLNWNRSTVAGVLKGWARIDELPLDPEVVATEKPPARTLFQRVSQDAEEAQRDFERLATELMAAEARVDAANDRVFAHLALEEKFREEAERKERELGRSLTQIEWYAIESFDRPSELEKAQMRAAYASNDGHERTRFEVAAMVRFDEWEEETARMGSRFFDFTDAYRRVDRIIAANDELAKRRIKTSEADASMEEAALETEPGLDESPGGSDPNE